MAWNAKPSGTTKIPMRDEPWLTPEMTAGFVKDIIPRYERAQGALMPILHDVQDHYGYVAYQAMIEIAKLLEIHPGQVLDTVSFYEEYTTEKVGKYVIGVCQSIACEITGHQTILDHVQEKLGIHPHETSADGRFTLLAMECLGACDGAPCCLINEDRFDRISIESLDEMIDKLP